VSSSFPRAASWRSQAGAVGFLEWALLGLGLGLILIFSRTPEIAGDGFARFEMLSRLLQHGALVEGKYSLIGPLFAAPLWYLSRWLEDPVWCARFNQCVLVLGLAAFYGLLRQPLGVAVTRRFLLLLVAASMFPRYVQGFYGEVFTVMLVGAGLLAIARGVARSGIVAVALGAANARATLLGLGFASLLHVWHTRKLRYFALVVLGAALVFGETWFRYGHPLANPYAGDAGFPTRLPYSGQPGFSYPFGFGLMSLLVSFGKGLVFFAPGILLWPRSADLEHALQVRHAFRLWLGFVVRSRAGLFEVVGLVRWLVLGAALLARRGRARVSGAGSGARPSSFGIALEGGVDPVGAAPVGVGRGERGGV
jgi:hypothetical protein